MQSDSVFNLENTRVSHYIHDFEYSNNYDYSLVTDYLDTLQRTDWPLPCIINPPYDCNANLSLFTNESFTINIPFLSEQESSKWFAYNLSPNNCYYFLIRDSLSGNIIQSGCFITKGQVRMIKAGSIDNVRDIGGWECSIGGRIKYGRVIRGSNPNGADDKDLQSLLEVGITSELDLRGENSTPLKGYVNYNFFSLGNFTDIENVERNAGAIRILIEELAKGENVYVHCIGGADRTGVFCMLVEGACGVSESDLAKDYELTSFSSKKTRTRNSGGFPEAMCYIKSFEGNTLQEKFVSYLKTGGITDEEIEILIRELVCDKPPTTNMSLKHPQMHAPQTQKYSMSGIQIKSFPNNVLYIKNGRKFLHGHQR